MQKPIFYVLGVFILWSIASTYWYTCHIKYLCNNRKTIPNVSLPILGNFSLPILTKPTPTISQTPNTDEINIPIHFSINSQKPFIDPSLNDDFKKLVAASKSGAKILITGQNEPQLNGQTDISLGSKYVNQTLSFLQSKGIPKNSIIVSTEGTIDSLSLTKYQFPNRHTILIIGENSTK